MSVFYCSFQRFIVFELMVGQQVGMEHANHVAEMSLGMVWEVVVEMNITEVASIDPTLFEGTHLGVEG